MDTIVGKRVRISEPYRLKIFYPSYRIVRETPLFQGKYIYVGERQADFDRHPSMIWVSRFSPEIDLDLSESVIELLQHFKKPSKQVVEFLSSLQTPTELWDKVRSFYVFDLLPEIETEKRIFDLFCTLNKSNKEIYSVFSAVKTSHTVIASSLVTMLVKSQNVRDVQSTVSPGYLRVLNQMHQTLKDVPNKLLEYYLSSRTELDLVKLLFDLKR